MRGEENEDQPMDALTGSASNPIAPLHCPASLWVHLGIICEYWPSDGLLGTFLHERSLIMCHGYEMRWWKFETNAKKKTREANPDVMRTFTAHQDEKAKAVSEDKVDEKELIPRSREGAQRLDERHKSGRA